MATNGTMKGMSRINAIITQLNKEPNREYSLSDITRERLFPWAKDLKTIRSIVHRDLNGENLLKAQVEGTGRTTRYTVKGKNLVRFLTIYGPGLMIGS